MWAVVTRDWTSCLISLLGVFGSWFTMRGHIVAINMAKSWRMGPLELYQRATAKLLSRGGKFPSDPRQHPCTRTVEHFELKPWDSEVTATIE
ncbi:hypothetical protein KQX54_011860 [Cotesia glomerata]|uniref:Uncharacterized protein n=1 Tax=Cotesia glomerata TaxID=32391 RepID=A0AAV7J847_COTGL|nr:hypothetical protein KQX54_011860 [Cotesia glomerata]